MACDLRVYMYGRVFSIKSELWKKVLIDFSRNLVKQQYVSIQEPNIWADLLIYQYSDNLPKLEKKNTFPYRPAGGGMTPAVVWTTNIKNPKKKASGVSPSELARLVTVETLS